MKRSWIRKMSVILSLCLILNSGFSDLAGYAHAAVLESAQNTAVQKAVDVSQTNSVSSMSVVSENEVETTQAPSETEETGATEGTTVTEGSSVEGSSVEETSVIETTVAEDESGSEDAEGEEQTQEDLSVETTTETFDEETTTEETTTEEETTEEETLEEALSLLAEGDIEVSVPADVDEFLAKAASSNPVNTISIYTWQDFINLQNLCNNAETYAKVNGFANITFMIQIPKDVPSGQMYWDSSQAEASGFTGIGTTDYPFKGKMKGAFAYTSGTTHLLLDRPLFAYLGDGASFSNMKIVANGCTSPIADNISGSVTISELAISGKIGKTGTGISGTIAGTIWPYTEVTVTEVTSTANVFGETAGGIAGIMYPFAEVIWPDGYVIGTEETPVTVTGTYAIGGLYGVLPGDYTIDLSLLNHVSTKVVGAGGFAGQLAGMVNGASFGGAEITVTGANSVKVDVTASDNGAIAGGLFGTGLNDVSFILPDPLTMDGTIAGGIGTAGGVFGELRDSGVELKNITIASTASVSASRAGGIVGYVNKVKMIIDTPTINGTLTSNGVVGGILGTAENECAVELQGTVTVLETLTGTMTGAVVGEQNTSLIYLSGVEGKINGTDQLVVPMISGDVHTVYNDVGNYGGVFRNQQMASGALLIGDGTVENVGVINNTITKSGEWYQIGTDGEMDSTADLETFAIAQYTDGKFGLTAFEGATACSDLLKASYQLNASANISYLTTGIVTLDRRDKVSSAAYAFSGKMQGVGDNITITQVNYLRKWYMGVFRTLAGDAEFSNLTIDGAFKASTNVGGLAYETIGTSLTLKDITVKKQYIEIYQGFGGVLLKENSNSGVFTLNAENVTLASTITAGSSTPEISGFITNMDNAEVNLKNIVLGGNLKSTGAGDVGGFLGKTWSHTGGMIDTVTVLSDTTYTTDAKFGGLIHTASNQEDDDASKLTMKNVDLANLSVVMSGQEDCGLLIKDGKKLILEVIDYSAAGVNVSGNAEDFDEIAADTMLRSSYAGTFGVISIHDTSKMFSGSTGNHYVNQATYASTQPVSNKSSRYYYDVFQHLENEDGSIKVDKIAKSNKNVTIDSAVDYFIVDIVQCCEPDKYPQLVNYFKKFFSDGTVPKHNGIYSLVGDLDLTDYSVYPMPRQYGKFIGTADTKLTFAAAGMEDWTLPNIDKSGEKYQHYQLHCGLLGSTYSGGIEIKDLTLTGSVGCLGFGNGGALVAGTLNGDATISNITLDGLYLSSYGEFGETSGKEKASLLIGYIRDFQEDEADDETKTHNNVIFDKIQMVNYTSNPYSTGGGQAAASLIGQVGDEDAKGIAIQFTDMKIEDDLTAEGAEFGTYLKYASYIYHYEYTDDATINKGSGLYLFTEQDEQEGWVTYGAELDYDTEYYDTVNKVLADNAKAPETVWIPYVYEIKDIEVNPKSGDILKGCGTYEDPYIIESTKQFLTLYRYINEVELDETTTEYQYKTFYTGWKVIKTGTDADTDFCATKHVAALASDVTAAGDITRTVTVEGVTYSFTGTGGEDARVFGESDFPTPDQLSQAYYQLGEDIDLSGITKGTYAQIAQDFAGFGTLQRPFTGVWYGKDAAGEIHTVTLPDKATDAEYTTYGFVQYAQGAVIKDIVIESPYNDEGTARLQTKIGSTIESAGGGVIACILGGDNIIDGVISKVHLQNNNGNASIGGYAGLIKKGGLILRNITDTSLVDFNITLTSVNDWNRGLYGVIAGKVEDGYILYEGSTSDSYLYEGMGGSTLTYTKDGVTYAYNQVGNYQVLNGTKLKNDSAGFSLTVTDTVGGTSEKDITISIPSAAGLQVMSMAMNANAFNIMSSEDTTYESGYTEFARCRKAAYDKIGNCTSVSEPDYVKAVAYDNVNGYENGTYNAQKAYGYPYLYQYMGIENDRYLEFMDGEYSILNISEVLNGTTYHMYWNLVQNGTYDMRVFNSGAFDSFRGIGGLYYPANALGDTITNIAGSTFRGDFNGNGSTILIDMERFWSIGDNGQSTAANVRKAGLFNAFYGPIVDTEVKGIYNHLGDLGSIDGTVENRPYYKISNFAIGGNIEIKPATNASNKAFAGGVVADIATGNYVFENISISDVTPLVIGKSTSGLIDKAGGIASRIGKEWYQISSRVLIQDCNWGSEESDITVRASNHAGGYVGEATAKVLQIKDSSIDNITVKSSSKHAGGMLGHFYYCYNSPVLLINGSQKDKTYVKNASITGWEKVGGVVGESYSKVIVNNVLCEKNTISAYNHMGGVFGQLSGSNESELHNINIKDIVTAEMDAYNGQHAGIGGVVGKNEHTLLAEDVTVTGTKTGDTYNCRIQGIEKNRTGACGVGGIVGLHTSKTLTLRDCKVADIALKVDGKIYTNGETVYTPALMAGGLVGFVEKDVMLDGVITTSNLYVQAPQQTELGEINYDLIGAGGCFGRIKQCFVGGYRTDSTLVYYKGLSTENNTIRGKNSGGICGYVDNGNVRLHGVKVTGGDFYGDSTAGGIYGYLIPKTEGLALNKEQTYTSTAQEDQNEVSDVTITGTFAGGAIGHAYASNRMRIENITVKNCNIHARKQVGHSKNSAGGLMGAVSLSNGKEMVLYGVTIDGNTIVCENEGTTIAEGKIVYPAAGGLIGRSMDNSKSGKVFCDLMTITENNQIGFIDSTATDPTVKLAVLNEADKVYELVDVELPENIVSEDDAQPKDYQAIDALVQKYGWCVGSVIGVADSAATQFYIWRSLDENNLFENPVMRLNPPVTDVGFNETAENTPGDDKYWRSQVHIVYGAPVTAVTDTVGDVSVTYKASDPAGNLAYMKMRVEETDTAYDPSTASLDSLLAKYRLSKEDVELFNNSYQESYLFPGTEYDIAEPILVLKTENGTVQDSMQRITNIMTNVAGDSATDIDETVLSVETKQLVVDEAGTITEGSGTPSITASISNSVVTYESAEYDEITEEGLTFTELTFTYQMPDAPFHKKVFKLRVLVEEPILYGVHMKILEGSVNSVSDIEQNGLLGTEDGTRVVIANDSDYTLLMEYTYGKAREKMPDEVRADKSFILKDSVGLKELPIGTKLRLIDVTHGNVPYYYTVDKTGITEVRFSEFKDNVGNPYINQSLNELVSKGEASAEDASTILYTDLAGHQLANTGVERYLLTVYNAETDNMGYQIHTNLTPQIVDADGKEDAEASESAKTQFAPVEEHEILPWFLVIAVPGLKISLQRTDEEGNDLTDIDGKITKEDSLTVKATILLDGDYLYWEYMNQDGLDSENNGKYLELAFYLRDEGRVNLPEGTNISYVTGTDEAGNKIYSANQIIKDNTVIYYYKDILEMAQLIDELTANANKNDITIPVEFVLNFAGGDLSELTSGEYEACIELLRTADSEYPMGSGNTLDIYTETIQAQAVNNLGFAIKSKFLEQLAVNTYPSAASENQIDYQTMFDFSDILEKISGVGEEAALEKWSGYDYEVTYQLWKKTENGENVIYERYNGDDIVIKVTDANGEQESISGSVTATYQFDKSEISNGTATDDIQQAGLIIRDGTMSLATANLVSASQDNLTNYKIIATMKIKERGASLTGEEATTEDFFVFTVTKLKTDLSE